MNNIPTDLSNIDDYPKYDPKLGELDETIGKVLGYDIMEEDILGMALRSGFSEMRIIDENTVVTMDYSDNRINIHIDKHNEINSVGIG